MTVTDVLALYGALLATGIAGWDVAKYFLERRHLRVTCYGAQIVTPGEGVSSGDLLAYNVANVGGKPVVVSRLGVAYRGGPHFMLFSETVKLPITLQPGESITVTGSMPQDIDQIECFIVHDGLGKQWKAPTTTVQRQLTEKAKK